MTANGVYSLVNVSRNATAFLYSVIAIIIIIIVINLQSVGRE